MSQTLADDSEVVFDQPGKSVGAMEPDARKKRGWKTRNLTRGPDEERWNSTGQSTESWVPLRAEWRIKIVCAMM